MDILLNPNIAYLLLVLGSVLLLLAIVIPGTGALEIGAFFALALAGYEIYYLGFNLWALIVLLLGIAAYIYVIRKPKQKWVLALSLVFVIAGSVYMFPGEKLIPAVNPILAIVTSIVTAGLIWLVVGKTIQAHLRPPSHDLEALVGQVGEAKTVVHEEGSVQVAGELWSARSEKSIPAGKMVRVRSREGFILLVEPVDKTGK